MFYLFYNICFCFLNMVNVIIMLMITIIFFFITVIVATVLVDAGGGVTTIVRGIVVLIDLNISIITITTFSSGNLQVLVPRILSFDVV